MAAVLASTVHLDRTARAQFADKFHALSVKTHTSECLRHEITLQPGPNFQSDTCLFKEISFFSREIICDGSEAFFKRRTFISCVFCDEVIH